MTLKILVPTMSTFGVILKTWGFLFGINSVKIIFLKAVKSKKTRIFDSSGGSRGEAPRGVQGRVPAEKMKMCRILFTVSHMLNGSFKVTVQRLQERVLF